MARSAFTSAAEAALHAVKHRITLRRGKDTHGPVETENAGGTNRVGVIDVDVAGTAIFENSASPVVAWRRGSEVCPGACCADVAGVSGRSGLGLHRSGLSVWLFAAAGTIGGVASSEKVWTGAIADG